MAINFVSLAATALRLIGENGRNVRFVRISREANVDAKPWRAPAEAGGLAASRVEVTVRAVDHPYTVYEIDETLVRKGDNRCYVSHDAFLVAAAAEDATAIGTLTFSGNALDGETVTLGSKTYTFQTVLTNVNGNVLIGATPDDSITNLVAAVGLGAGSGTLYAAATTAHPTASAGVGFAPQTLVASALAAGAGGNAIVTTDTLTNASWGSATLTGGVTVSRNLEDYDMMEEVGDGSSFRLLKVTPIKPADVTVIYDIHMRR